MSIVSPRDFEESTLDFFALNMCSDGNLSLGLQALTEANDQEFSFRDI